MLEYNGKVGSIGMFTKPSWSPDGKEVIFTYYNIDEEKGSVITGWPEEPIGTAYYFPWEVQNAIPVIMAVNISSGEKRIYRDAAKDGALSPDGSLFAYVGLDSRFFTDPDNAVDNNKVWIVDMASGNAREIGLMESNTYDMRISPDNKEIIFAIREGGQLKMSKMAIDTGVETKLDEYSFDGFPALSYDCRYVTYEYPVSSGKVTVLDLDTGEKRQILNGFFGRIDGISWSHDNAKLALNLEIENKRQIYVADVSAYNFSAPTYVEAEEPAAFMLGENYPNPFNPTTEISYSIPSGNAGHVKLNVYDMRGALIKTLVNDHMRAGNYSVRWNATDQAGHDVAAGVYLYQLCVGNKVESRKMLLIK